MKTRVYNGALTVTLDELKVHLRMTTSEFDSDLDVKLHAAINSSENFIRRILTTSTFTLTRLFANIITLDDVPVNSVTSVKVDDMTLTDDNWSYNDNTITINDDVTGSEIEIIYTAGDSQLPYDIKAAILLQAAALFNNPIDSVENLPKASTNLLRPYRKWRR